MSGRVARGHRLQLRCASFIPRPMRWAKKVPGIRRSRQTTMGCRQAFDATLGGHLILSPGRACGVAWVREGKTEKPRTKPQNKACTQNLTHACPAGWRCANGLCHAPPSYQETPLQSLPAACAKWIGQGTCLRAIKMTHFDARLKKAMARNRCVPGAIHIFVQRPSRLLAGLHGHVTNLPDATGRGPPTSGAPSAVHPRVAFPASSLKHGTRHAVAPKAALRASDAARPPLGVRGGVLRFADL